MRSNKHPRDASAEQASALHRGTRSTPTEAGRIRDWNYDVVTAVPSFERQQGPSDHFKARRGSSKVRSTEVSGNEPLFPQALAHEGDNGSRSVGKADPGIQQNAFSSLNATTVVSMLLGAAAGAALTYTFATSEKALIGHDRVRPSSDVKAEGFQSEGKNQRAQLPGLSVKQVGNHPFLRSTVPHTTRYEPISDAEQVRKSQVQRGPGSRYPPRAGQVNLERAERRLKDEHVPRSEVYSPNHTYQPQSRTSRSRSEEPSYRVPLRLSDRPWNPPQATSNIEQPRAYSSNMDSRKVQRSVSSWDDFDKSTYVSARTHGTSRTAGRTAPRASHSSADQDVIYYNGLGSKVSRARSTASRSHVRLAAHEVPLPPSGVGSSRANWDDDLDSVAPSDSISCVGSKSSRRSRYGR